MTDFGKQWSMKVTAPIVGLGAATFRAHMEFEKSMSQIIGLVGVAEDQVAAWSEELLQMGPALGKTPQELADGLFFVTSAGLRGEAALEALNISARASAAGLGETKVVADLVTSAINAYGAENLSAGQAADILTAAVREGKAEASELASVMGNVLPIAAEMGVSFDQVGAATAAMTRTGTDAATASTQLRAIMVSLLKPTEQAEEALGMMGVSSSELRKQMGTEGLFPVLERLRKLTNEYGEEVMAQVFPNIRALAGVLDLVGENAEENEAIFKSLTDTTGSLDHAFETASETTRFQWDQALAQASASAVSLGEAVKTAAIPVIQDATKLLQDLTEWFTSLDEEQQQNIIRWAGIVAAMGPFAIVGGSVVKGAGAMLGTFGRLNSKLALLATKSFPATGAAGVGMGAKLSALAAAAGPIAGLALALGGLGIMTAGLVDQIRDSLRTKEDVVNEIMGRIQENYESAYDGILAAQIEASMERVQNEIEHLKELEDLTEGQLDRLKELEREHYRLSQAERRANNLAQHKLMVQLGEDLADATLKGEKEVKQIIEEAWQGKEALVSEQFNQERFELEQQYVELGKISFEEWKKQDAALQGHHRRLIEEIRDNFGAEMVMEYGDMLVLAGYYWDRDLGEIRKIQRNHLGNIMTDLEYHHAPQIVDAYAGMVRDIRRAFDIDLAPLGSQALSSWVAGILSERSSVGAAMREVARDVRNLLPASPAKEGPLSKLPDWGSYFEESLLRSKHKIGGLMANTLKDIVPDMKMPGLAFAGAGISMPAGLAEGRNFNGATQTLRHEGRITIEGVNDRGQFIDAVEVVYDGLESEDPRIVRSLDRLGHMAEERFRGRGDF